MTTPLTPRDQDFDDMERRPAGGGGGVLIWALIFGGLASSIGVLVYVVLCTGALGVR